MGLQGGSGLLEVADGAVDVHSCCREGDGCFETDAGGDAGYKGDFAIEFAQEVVVLDDLEGSWAGVTWALGAGMN